MDDIANHVRPVEELLSPSSTTNVTGGDRMGEETGGTSQEKIERFLSHREFWESCTERREDFLRRSIYIVYIDPRIIHNILRRIIVLNLIKL